MRWIGWAHFDNLFGKILNEIRDDFDILADKKIAPTLDNGPEQWLEETNLIYWELQKRLFDLMYNADEETYEYYEGRVLEMLREKVILWFLMIRGVIDGKARKTID